jgi:hypothetical protein
MPERDTERHTAPGQDVLAAHVYGDNVPEFRMAALDQARQLFGPDAVLRIERVESINTTTAQRPGRTFMATVIVRRLDEGDEWVAPLGGAT